MLRFSVTDMGKSYEFPFVKVRKFLAQFIDLTLITSYVPTNFVVTIPKLGTLI